MIPLTKHIIWPGHIGNIDKVRFLDTEPLDRIIFEEKLTGKPSLLEMGEMYHMYVLVFLSQNYSSSIVGS